MKIRMNKKGGVPIAVFVLVIATIFLCSFALFTFYTSGQKVYTETNDFAFIDIDYKTSLIEIYLNNIIDKVARASNSEDEFLVNFDKELLLYKVDGKYEIPEMEQFENKLSLDSVKFENGVFDVDVEITLNSYDQVSGTYVERTFVKNFKVTKT